MSHELASYYFCFSKYGLNARFVKNRREEANAENSANIYLRRLVVRGHFLRVFERAAIARYSTPRRQGLSAGREMPRSHS
jgi:hypothetical protein